MTLAPRDVDQCAFFAADTPTGNTVGASFPLTQPAAIPKARSLSQLLEGFGFGRLD